MQPLKIINHKLQVILRQLLDSAVVWSSLKSGSPTHSEENLSLFDADADADAVTPGAYIVPRTVIFVKSSWDGFELWEFHSNFSTSPVPLNSTSAFRPTTKFKSNFWCGYPT